MIIWLLVLTIGLLLLTIAVGIIGYWLWQGAAANTAWLDNVTDEKAK